MPILTLSENFKLEKPTLKKKNLQKLTKFSRSLMYLVSDEWETQPWNVLLFGKIIVQVILKEG